MSNVQNSETKTGAAPAKQRTAPDGKSPLPDTLPDFPTPVGGGGGDGGPTGGPVK